MEVRRSGGKAEAQGRGRCVLGRDLIKQVVEDVVVHPQRDVAASDTKHTGKSVSMSPVRRSELGRKLRKRLDGEGGSEKGRRLADGGEHLVKFRWLLFGIFTQGTHVVPLSSTSATKVI